MTAAAPVRAPPSRSPAPQPAPQAAQPQASQTPTPDLTRHQAALTGGAPLPPTTRSRLEASFGQPLAEVRVHTGGAAARATAELGAEAFATGPHIAFAPGRYAPGSPSGDHLLAEEVAHVLQQRGSGGQIVQRHATLSQPSDTAETEARAAADAVAAGRPARVNLSGLSQRGRILRRARAFAVPPSPVVSLPTLGLGAPPPGSGPVLTPAMTASVSPAGGRLVDGAARREARPGSAGPQAKSPDEAQTAQPPTAPGPVNVMRAGAPAGAPDEARPPGAEDRRTRRAKARKGERRDAKEDRQEEAAGPEPPPGARARRGRFGRIQGDRGAAMAEAAKRRLSRRAAALRTNETAEKRIEAARAAAQPAPNAAQAAGKRQYAGDFARTKVRPASLEVATEAATAAVDRQRPTDSLMAQAKLQLMASVERKAERERMAQAIAGEVATQTGPVRNTLAAVNAPPEAAKPPDPDLQRKAEDQPDPLPAPGTPAPALAQATPPPVNEAALDASEFREEADTVLQENDAGGETLARAEEGPLRAVAIDKRDLDGKVDAAALRARGVEGSANTAARADLKADDTGAQAAMLSTRSIGQKAVSAEQDTTRGDEQTGHLTLAGYIDGRYNDAQREVDKQLKVLDGKPTEFQDRQAQLLEAFAAGVRRDLDAFKEGRYSGLGKLLKVKDFFFGVNSLDAVQDIYQRNRDHYVTEVDLLIARIKAEIDRTVADCLGKLAKARADIDEAVSGSKTRLDADAKAALERAQKGFAEMESRIAATAASTRAALDAGRQRAIAAMDAELDKIKAENAGLVDRIANAIRALVDLLRKFFKLLTRVTRMGVGNFLSAGLSQAKEGIRDHLWDELREAFKQWLFARLPALDLLLNLPPNWVEMLTVLATNMIGLFMDALPELLPVIAVAAMTWLAVSLAAKLIPGAGAIMAVIDAIKAAYALIQSLLTAAAAFFEFVMQVANRENGAVTFARALAHGIIAALAALLTFLGVDRLIRAIVGAILRPFKRVIGRIQERYKAFMARRRQRSEGRRAARSHPDDDGPAVPRRGRGEQAHAEASARSHAERHREDSDRRDATRARDRRQDRPPTEADRRHEQERRRRERLDHAIATVGPAVDSLLARGVTTIRLRAQLALWRVRHRLRKLALEGDSVVAGNSDDRTVRRVISGSTEGVYRMVHEIGEERFKRAARRLEGQPLPTVQTVHRVVPGDDPLQLAASLERRPPEAIPLSPKIVPDKPRRAGGPVHLQVGETPVAAKQGSGLPSSPLVQRNLVIEELGRYPEITQQLEREGLSGVGVTRAVQEALRTGRGSPTVMKLIALMFGREPLQAQSSAATSPLALLAMQAGTPTARVFGEPGGGPVAGDIFTAGVLDPEIGKAGNRRRVGGGIAPFTPVGAAADQRLATAAFLHGGTLSPSTDAGRRATAAMLREVELVYQAVRLMRFSDTAALRREILQLFDQFDRASGVPA